MNLTYVQPFFRRVFPFMRLRNNLFDLAAPSIVVKLLNDWSVLSRALLVHHFYVYLFNMWVLFDTS